MVRNSDGTLTPIASKVYSKARPMIVSLFNEFSDRFSYEELYLIINYTALEICNNAYILDAFSGKIGDTDVGENYAVE